MKLLTLLALLFAVPAFADEMKPAARVLLTRGLRAYEVQKYQEAIEDFRAGYQIDPRREFLYALGQAERMAGETRAAIEAYRAFLRTEPPPLQASSARQNLARCEAQLASAPPPPPAPSPSPVAALAVAAPPTLIAAPKEPRRLARDVAGHALLALGVAGVITGGALWGVGQSEIDGANSADRYDRFAQLHGAAGSAEGERIGGMVAVAVGGALMVAAIIHYAVWTRGR